MPLDLNRLRKPTYEELFNESNDLFYVILAIGASPEDPPIWARAVCAAVLEAEQVMVPASSTGAPPKHPVDDGLLLDRVADLVLQGKSKTAAVKEVTGEEADGTNFRRLMRIWNRASRPKMLQSDREDEALTNKWLRRAFERKHEAFMQTVFAEARRQIKEGDLNVDESPESTARREGAAKWLTFSKDYDPDQEAKIKLAPMTTEVWVLNAKRVILENPEMFEDYMEDAEDG